MTSQLERTQACKAQLLLTGTLILQPKGCVRQVHNELATPKLANKVLRERFHPTTRRPQPPLANCATDRLR